MIVTQALQTRTDLERTARTPAQVVAFDVGIAGAYACRLLSDGGAEVTIVLPEDGSALQRWSASGVDGSHGLLFRHLVGDARSVGEEDPGAREALDGADIVIIDRVAGDTMGLSMRAAVHAARDRAVVVDLSVFGNHEPVERRPANEFSLQASCGSMGWRGNPRQRPIAAGGRLGEWATGLFGALAATAGLAARAGRSTGVSCAVSMFESMVGIYNPFEWLRTDFYDPPRDFGRWLDIPSVEAVQDGWVGITCITPDQWRAFIELAGAHEFDDEPAYELLLGRVDLRERLDEACGPWLRSRPAQQVLADLAEAGVPSAPVGNGQTLPTFDHLQERGMFVSKGAGSFVAPASPILLDGRRLSSAESGPLSHAGAGSVAGSAPGKVSAQAPLAGVRVLDLGAFWAGPGCGQILASLGASVLKIEGVGRPDGMRLVAPRGRTTAQWYEYNAIYQGANAGKDAAAIELTTREGRELVLRLAGSADVVVENYPPQVLTRFGITYAELARRNPGIVMVHIPAFGSSGPWRNRRGYATTMDHISGTSWVTGELGGPPAGVKSYGDYNGSAHAALAAMFALARRAHTGRGANVEVALSEAAIATTAEQVLEFSATGTLLTRTGSRRLDAAPQGIFHTSDGEWLAVAVLDDKAWAAAADAFAADLPWAGLQFPTLADRLAAVNELDSALSDLVQRYDAAPLQARLRAAGVAAEIVRSPSYTDEDPDLVASGLFRPLTHPLHGPLNYTALPFTLDGLRPGPRRPAPMYGEHNDILVELGVVTTEELAALREAGVVADVPDFRARG